MIYNYFLSRLSIVFSLIISIGALGSIHAQEKQTLFQLIHSNSERMKITINTDYRNLMRKSQKEEYQQADFSLEDQDGKVVFASTGKIRARGNTRKKVCNIPPVKFKFSDEDLESAGLDTIDNLKFVLPCRTRDADQEYLYRERFLYDLYQLIDPNGILATLVDVQFINDGKQEASYTAFLVEDEDEYAHRMSARIIESGRLNVSVLERELFVKMFFFQYMIGNTDWAIEAKHNVELVKLPGFTRVVALPYDYDYSGFVDQPYAIPHETMPIKDVTERYFLRYKLSDEEIQQAITFYQSIESDVFELLGNYDTMNEKTKKACSRYLEEFFEILEKPSRLRRLIAKS